MKQNEFKYFFSKNFILKNVKKYLKDRKSANYLGWVVSKTEEKICKSVKKLQKGWVGSNSGKKFAK